MRVIDTIIDGLVQREVVKKWRISFWNGAERVIESSLSLPELYIKYEAAATIEEIE
jgi:hypothetical protein